VLDQAKPGVAGLLTFMLVQKRNFAVREPRPVSLAKASYSRPTAKLGAKLKSTPMPNIPSVLLTVSSAFALPELPVALAELAARPALANRLTTWLRGKLPTAATYTVSTVVFRLIE
jgi:hypothetical protein